MRARSFRLPKPLLAVMLITLIAVAALPGQAGATPAPGTLLWARKLTASSGGLNSVAVAPDGQTVFVTGSAANELVTAAYTSSGTKLWLKTHTGTNCCIDAGRSIVVSPDGASVFVTGNTGVVDGTIDVVTIGYDVATGVELWTKVYDRGSMDGDGTTTSQHDYGEAIGISPDGATVYVAAETQYVLDSTIHADYGTLAYNAVTGHRQWASFYDGGVGSDSPRSLIVSPDGATVYVTGYSASAQSSAITTVAYDTSDGTQIWAQPFEGPAGQNDTGWSLAMKPDGSAVYVTGGTGGTGNGTGDWDMVTMALDTTDGSVLWDKLYNSPSDGYDFGRSVTVDSAGKRVYVMGHSLGTTGNYDITTLAYNAETGKRAWVERAPGPSVNLGLTGGVAVTPDGTKIVVASYRVRSGQNDTSTISYSASGALRWKQSYNVADVDRLTSVAISPNGGRAFVAGYTANDTILAYKV